MLSSITSAATVQWSTPTYRENGKTLLISEIGGYSIRYKSTESADTQIIQVTPGSVTQYALPFDVKSGYTMLQIAVYDTDGLYSNYADVDTAGLPVDPLAEFSQTIQAENYTSMSGVYNETTSDTGGGQNTGNINANDWMSYSGTSVKIPATGSYKITYRVASLNGGGSFNLTESSTGALWDTVPVPSTGGWQNWVTVERTVKLTAGIHAFDVNAITGGFNVNWFKIESVAASSSSSVKPIASSSSSAKPVTVSSSSTSSSSATVISSVAVVSSSRSVVTSTSSIKSSSASSSSVLTIPTTSKKVPTVVPVGLKGSYYVYKSTDPLLTSLVQVNSTFSSSRPSFVFTSTILQYGPGEDNLIDGLHYREFLKADAITISRNPSSVGTGVIIRLTGMIKLPVGQFSLQVNSDDGYSISVNKKVVAEFNGNQAPTVRKHLPFKITKAGYYPVDIIYWDAGGQYVFEVKMADTTNGVYNVVDKAILFNF